MLSRIILDNQIYFVTTKTFRRRNIFSNHNNCQVFIDTLDNYRKFFKLYGFVIIPNHIHLLIEPIGIDISKLMNYIKGKSSRLINLDRVAEPLGSAIDAERERSATRFDRVHVWQKVKCRGYADTSSPPSRRRGIQPRRSSRAVIWQKSFYEHAIRSNLDFIEKLNYIHKNPLKHNITDDLNNYPWSSYQNYYLDNNYLIKIDNIEL